jgi:hypothetical protein
MLTNIIYVTATTSLLVGSILTFESDIIADYFYLIGTSLFFIKSSLTLGKEIKDRKKKITIYNTIN